MPDFRWTEEQTRVLLEERHALLSASAGTGKTRTIVGKIAWLLGLDVGHRTDGLPIPRCPNPCPLDQIAAITFTEKAASELKERLREEIEASERAPELRWEVDRASVGTIHAFCADLLRDHALRLGVDPTFRVLDEREAALCLNQVIHDEVMASIRSGDDAIDGLLERFDLYDGQRTSGLIGAVASVVREVRWHGDLYEAWLTGPEELAAPQRRAAARRRLDAASIADLARKHLGPEAFTDAGDQAALELAGTLHDLARRCVRAWLGWMEEENVRDFDSLILDVRRLLACPEHHAALVAIRGGLRILIIDEFQDTDGAQRDIAFALAGVDEPEAWPAPQLLLVGDPKQSIYGFRGADVGVWNDVRGRLCGDAAPLELTGNFRTQPGVIEFINQAASAAIEDTGAALEALDPGLRIAYTPLTAHRPPGPGQGIEWLDCSGDGGSSEDRQQLEMRLVLSRIRALLDGGRVCDERAPEGHRPVRRSDIAILARYRRTLDRIDRALQEAQIPAYNAARLGLSERQEVLDLVTVLRLLADPADDYHAFAFLRSPFVGLRDEVIARIRLDPATRGGPLLRQAARWLERVHAGEAEWYEGPEHAAIAAVEREALARGLAALDDAGPLAGRAAASELLEEVVRRTGYRLHLLLRPAAEEALAALERFAALLDEYRRLSLGSFLDLWDQWGEQDVGIPRAPLHGAADDVVTLQTVHTAKGLEWPIVFLLRAGEADRDRLGGTYLTDPRLGPVLMPRRRDRGVWAGAIAARARAAERAEEARLLYVALTRARDRIVVAAPDVERGYMNYMRPALSLATLPHLAPPEAAAPARRPVPASRARAEDPVTRTGGQIEVFSEDASGQLDIFRHAPTGGDEPATAGAEPSLRPVVYRAPDPEQRTIDPVPVSLSWLDGLAPGELPSLPCTVEVARERSLVSATELQMRETDPAAWRLRYVHGVEEPWRFAPAGDADVGVPAELRGILIHGVLERIRAARELSRLLDETIAEVDAPPGVEALLQAGAPYRAALEAEIERVVTGDRWRGYVAGRHSRELPFLVLGGEPPWRTGTIDLYRPGDGGWIVDFKTHRIEAGEARRVADDYAVQAAVYRSAVTAIGGRTPRVILHFTHPDTAVELPAVELPAAGRPAADAPSGVRESGCRGPP